MTPVSRVMNPVAPPLPELLLDPLEPPLPELLLDPLEPPLPELLLDPPEPPLPELLLEPLVPVAPTSCSSVSPSRDEQADDARTTPTEIPATTSPTRMRKPYLLVQ